MSHRPTGPRRASVQIHAEAVASLPSVSGRALHHYWSLLAQHFRGIFLPPLWRADDSGLAWSWSEPAARSTLSGAELATVRKRLAAAQRSLTEAAEDAPSDANPRSGANLAQLAGSTATIVQTLGAMPDAALAPFVVRCELGLMLHSWGLPTALIPFDPETAHRSAGGTVLIGGQPGSHVKVTLSASTGPMLAHQSTDDHGRFEFSKLAPGSYRVTADSGAGAFPVGGLVIDLEHNSATGLVLRDASLSPPSRPTTSRRRGPIVAISLFVVALLGGGLWWWQHRPKPAINPTSTQAKTYLKIGLANHRRTNAPRISPSPLNLPHHRFALAPLALTSARRRHPQALTQRYLRALQLRRRCSHLATPTRTSPPAPPPPSAPSRLPVLSPTLTMLPRSTPPPPLPTPPRPSPLRRRPPLHQRPLRSPQAPTR